MQASFSAPIVDVADVIIEFAIDVPSLVIEEVVLDFIEAAAVPMSFIAEVFAELMLPKLSEVAELMADNELVSCACIELVAEVVAVDIEPNALVPASVTDVTTLVVVAPIEPKAAVPAFVTEATTLVVVAPIELIPDSIVFVASVFNVLIVFIASVFNAPIVDIASVAVDCTDE
jgi:hypothetical protein